MFRSIFQKQLVMFVAALLICLASLGVAMSMIIENFYITQRANVLTQQGQRMAAILENGVYDFPQFRMLASQVNILHDYANGSVIFLDSAFNIILKSSDIDTAKVQNLNIRELQPLRDGEIVTLKGNLGGIFQSPVLTVAYPAFAGNRFAGAVLLNSSMPEIQRAVTSMYKVTLLCLLLCALIGLAAAFLFSRSISRPLKEMNDAAKIIAGGNFEMRIGINSRDEVGQLATSFNNMAESLQTQEESRKLFIEGISHDLRSPLTSIRGFLQAIQDGTIPREKQERYLQIVLDETERLSRLTNNILDMNKAQDARIELDMVNFDINELVRKTVQMFETRIIEKDISISLNFASEFDIVSADYEKIHRVIGNLLDNAIKFTQPGGRIEIRTEVSGGKVFVTVSDNGMGLSEQDKKRVFDRFYKADASRGEDKNGSGLGLAIVRAFIVAHGETVTVGESAEGGAAFRFSMRAADGKLEV